MRRTLICALAAAALTLTSAVASAAPVKIATPSEVGSPSVAVASNGTAIVAWADTDVAPNTVQWCVLPPGAAACSTSGSLQPADDAQYVDGVQALINGSTIVVLADTFGASGEGGNVETDYEPVQDWQSTDGGQSFSALNGGKSVAAGNPSNDTQPVGGINLPGGGLGFAFQTAAAYPTFHAFALTNPTSCGRADNACADGYATLEPATNPDAVTNAGGQVASVSTGSLAGVMTVFNTNFTSGTLGCSNSRTVPFGTAFAFGSGAQSLTNNYNVSPGQPNSAWRVPITQLDCNVDYPAVGAGPAGYGVLEDNEVTGTTIYHRFNAAADSFDITPVTVASKSEQQPSLSQDGAGNIYAVYELGGVGGPISLSYSADGGKTWVGPATLAKSPANGIHDLTSNVNATGHGWAVWDSNGSVYASSFTATDSLVAPTIDATGSTSKKALSLKVGCTSAPCTLKVTVSKKVGHKTITVGSKTFHLSKRGVAKRSIKLTRAGRRYRSSHHGTLKLTVSLKETAAGTTKNSKRTVTVKNLAH